MVASERPATATSRADAPRGAAAAWERWEVDMNERAPETDPFLRLTVGVTVYTDDGQKIGTVKEIQGRYFKVGTGLLQRDFWLPADCIESAVAGEPVALPFSKGPDAAASPFPIGPGWHTLGGPPNGAPLTVSLDGATMQLYRAGAVDFASAQEKTSSFWGTGWSKSMKSGKIFFSSSLNQRS
jgi:hypothetical protein